MTISGMRSNRVSRLAPSPTGVLHLGNARTFLLNWLYVRKAGGTLLLRVEDIDGPRVKAGAEDRCLEDLAWLGLDWDGDLLRQSERQDLYRKALDELLAKGLAYPCTCSRKEVEEAASAPHESWQDAPAYPGTCRDRYESMAAAREESGLEPAVRFRVDVDRMDFVDGFSGVQAGMIRGDFVIRKRDTWPAYQLAVVVDDAATCVNTVLRGDDLIASTPRQLLLYQALGLQAPEFLHLPLVVGTDGRRLAKRHGDTSLRAFREAGVTPEQVLGYLASVSGLRASAAEVGLADLLDGFSLDRVPAETVVWGGDELG